MQAEEKPDMINRPPHYNHGKIQPIDVIEDWKLDPHESFVVKYIARARHKGERIADLKKARWYLDRKINLLEKSDGGAA